MEKGFYFSFDAFISMTVMIGALVILGTTSDIATSSQSAETESFRKASLGGQDSLRLSSSTRIVNSINSTMKTELLNKPGLNFSEEDLNRSLIDAVTYLWAQNTTDSREMASKISREFFRQRIPEDYGFRVQVNQDGNSTIIYNSSYPGSSKIVSSSSRPVSGHRIGSPSEGFQARVSLSRAIKNETERTFIGGYVGDGDLIFTPELPDLDTVLNVTLEGDFSGEFELYHNGNYAGTYTPENSENLTADIFQVCTNQINESRCEALDQGENQIEFRFTGINRSVGGGLIRIDYNRTTGLEADQGTNKVMEKDVPGIEGIINYFGGFYVPGNLKGVNGTIHYEADNQTVFLRIGNSTIYESRTIGEETVELSNSSIYGNLTSDGLDYSSISRETVPLRIGLANLDQVRSRAIADSVSVVDVSGSMNDDPDGDGKTLLDEAKNASKTFADIILNASTNRAGFVSYETEVEDVQPLTDNDTQIEQVIENQVAGGNTCIGCGIMEANKTLSDPYVEELISRKTEWKYSTDYLDSSPPEKNGRNWTDLDYNDSDWSSGDTVIGSESFHETQISDYEGNVYLRKEFFSEHTEFWNLTLGILSNDRAEVYLNGELVDNDSISHLGERWNREILMNSSSLKLGQNVIAVKLKNAENDTVHWETENLSEWNSGTFSNTTVLDDKLMLEIKGFKSSGSDVDAGNYCTVSGDDTFTVEEVEFNGVNRFSGDNNGYLDATDSISDPLIPGKNYRINVTFDTTYFFSSYPNYASVVFDWDGDDQIDDNNVYEVGTCSSGTCQVSTELTVPESASYGSHLMRVMAEYNGYHKQPCGDTTYNEIEDYSAHVGKPEYANGSYTSKEFDPGEKVDWKNVRVKNHTNTETEIEIDYSDGSNWYDSLEDVPDSSSLKFNISIKTFNNTSTPEIDSVDISYLVNESTASFEAELNGTQKRKRSMIVMSDGEVNQDLEISSPDHSGDNPENSYCDSSADDPCDDTIEAACRAHDKWNVTVYSVGFGSGADNQTLNQTAECGGGKYYYSSTGELEQIFRNISNQILNASFAGQTIKTGDEAAFGELHTDTEIRFNYSSNLSKDFGEVIIDQRSSRFGGAIESPKNGSFRIPSNTELKSARLLSYSGNYWTDRVSVETDFSGWQEAYNLSSYGTDYRNLGDPAIVNIPVDLAGKGQNNVSVDTALNYSEPQGGSPQDRVFYSLYVNGSVGFGNLYPTQKKAKQDARERLRKQLDADGDGNIDVSLEDQNLDFSSSSTKPQPFVWGPALFKVVVWE